MGWRPSRTTTQYGTIPTGTDERFLWEFSIKGRKEAQRKDHGAEHNDFLASETQKTQEFPGFLGWHLF